MVYRGKPSKGCFQCRRRRIKCDQKRPGCTQCSNAGVPCAGYRKAEDLMFLDETASTTQKYHSQSSRSDAAAELHSDPGSLRSPTTPASSVVSATPSPTSASGRSPLSATSSSSFSASSSSNSNSSALIVLPQNTALFTGAPSMWVEDFALTFFLGSYVGNSRFDYVPKMYGACTQPQSPLLASVSACALASLSFELEDTKIAAIARKRYSRALSLTNKALTRPQEAVHDETLAAVLVLSLFETITQSDEVSQASWEAHVNGAAMLLHMRGKSQFQTGLGRMLYLHAADSIRMKCFQNGHAVPKHLRALDAVAPMRRENIIVQLNQIITDLADLRSSISESGEADSSSLIPRYRIFEEKVLAMSRKYPSLTSYTEHHIEPTPEIFEGTYYIYPHKNSMRITLVLQMILIWLCEQIMKVSTPRASGDDPNQEERERAAIRGRDAARKICATVPQLMGDVPPPPDGGLPSRIVLIWPLSMMGERQFLPLPLREYVIAQLRRIGLRDKIPQATTTAEALAGDRTKPKWVHMYHIT